MFIFLLTLGFQEVVVLGFSSSRFDVSLDLHTQYPAPWGGQGWSKVSDAFPPGAVVELRADLTFKGDGVSGKPVTYLLRAPNGEIFSTVAIAQSDGASVVTYVLPSAEPYFGLWTVQASADVAGGKVSDMMWFLMGWLVEVIDVDVPTFALKETTMEVCTKMTRICLQDPMDIMRMLFRDASGEPFTDGELLLCISVTDAVSQFVASSQSKAPITSEPVMYDLKEFVAAVGSGWNNYSNVILKEFPALVNTAVSTVTFPVWAFTGMATVHASVITNKLTIALCYECLGQVWLRKASATELPVTPKPEDVNNDGKIDVNDLNIVAAAFGSHGPDIPELGDLCSDNWNALADLNADGWIDIDDVMIVVMDYDANG
ncbi:MAG TPA: hypothetical protein VIH48_04020 [Candidatus Bathyarchaeia archaeon]